MFIRYRRLRLAALRYRRRALRLDLHHFLHRRRLLLRLLGQGRRHVVAGVAGAADLCAAQHQPAPAQQHHRWVFLGRATEPLEPRHHRSLRCLRSPANAAETCPVDRGANACRGAVRFFRLARLARCVRAVALRSGREADRIQNSDGGSVPAMMDRAAVGKSPDPSTLPPGQRSLWNCAPSAPAPVAPESWNRQPPLDLRWFLLFCCAMAGSTSVPCKFDPRSAGST